LGARKLSWNETAEDEVHAPVACLIPGEWSIAGDCCGSAKIEFVSSDRWKPCLGEIREKCSPE
jgi:hypothetical protein